jgi:hypothetical protein
MQAHNSSGVKNSPSKMKLQVMYNITEKNKLVLLFTQVKWRTWISFPMICELGSGCFGRNRQREESQGCDLDIEWLSFHDLRCAPTCQSRGCLAWIVSRQNHKDDLQIHFVEFYGLQTKKQDFESQAQLEMEEKLTEQEREVLKVNYKKYEIIDKSMHDGIIPKLPLCYKISLAEEI